MYRCVPLCGLDKSSFAIFCSVSVLHLHCEPLPISLNTHNFCCLVGKFCANLWVPMDSILPGSSVHGISQARILEWVVIPFSRGSSWPRDWTWVSCIGRWILYPWGTGEAQIVIKNLIFQCVNMPPPRNQTQVSRIAGRFFIIWAP